ncbi:MAG: GNAT family N-acetyltransferase [Novosphingobium sp.]
MDVRIEVLTGAQVLAAVDDLARLRIAVFAEWPYLYDGERGYEEGYLREFAEAPGAVLVAARDGAQVVGMATASPMAAQKAEFRGPFESRRMDVAGVFYFGESVLLPEYRGRGVGHAFFDHREAAARRYGAIATTFAAVVRPPDHPDRPEGYVPLDGFWRRRGYAPVEGLVTELAWKDHRDAGDCPKPMQFWMRELG